MMKKKEPYEPSIQQETEAEYREQLLSLHNESVEKFVEDKKLYKNEPVEIKDQKKSGTSTTVIKKMIRDMQTEEMRPLEMFGNKVVGNLFDRVNFLRQRMNEMDAALRERKFLNVKFNEEIEKDIEEMEKIISSISDREMLREFKLNITLLRMEKRKENTNFWKDVLALRTQLQETKEQYDVESNISQMFNGLSGGNG